MILFVAVGEIFMKGITESRRDSLQFACGRWTHILITIGNFLYKAPHDHTCIYINIRLIVTKYILGCHTATHYNRHI